MKLAIIGTAGRGDDGNALTKYDWNTVCGVSQGLYHGLGAKELVSGGAAWMDHIAVRLYLKSISPKLTLHLPAPFGSFGFNENPKNKYDTGRTSNHYHYLFSQTVGFTSLDDIKNAIDKGANATIGNDFKSRNTLIANEANYVLAFTFGHGPILKDGGTKDTMDKFLKKRKEAEDNKQLHGFRAFHFDLNIKLLFEI